MAFVDEDQRIVGDVFEQRRRRLARLAAGQIARIVLDAGARAGGLEHLQVEARALLQPLRLQQPAGLLQLGQPADQLFLDRLDRLVERRARRHIVRIGVDLDRLQVAGLLAGQRIEFGDGLDLVAEHGDAPRRVFQVGRKDLDRVAAHAERAAHEIDVLALVLLGDEVGEQRPLVEPVADRHLERHRRIGLDRADTVDARHRGDDDDIVALEQRARRRMAHAVDLLVDRRFLLDIGVAARDVGLRLVVVVVGDEILDRVVGEEFLELAVELRRQRLVGRQDQRRTLRLLDHLGHGERLAGAGDAEQHLRVVGAADALDQILDRRRLVAGRLEIRLHDDRDAALGLFRPGRPVRRPQLAVLVQRVAALDQRRQRRHGRGDARTGHPLGVFQVDVEPGDRVQAGGRALARRSGAAHRGAARRLGRGRRALRDFFGLGPGRRALPPPWRSARPIRRPCR